MPKISDKPLEAIQVRLFQEDLNVLRKLYKGSFGVNRAIRGIVHTFVTQTQAAANAKIDQQEHDGLMNPMPAGESLSGEEVY